MRVRAWVCRSVWSTALVGSLLAGCGGATDANSEASESSGAEAEAVFKGFVPDADDQVHAATTSCASGVLTWSQPRATWNSNGNTAGTYFCEGNVSFGSQGSYVTVMTSNAERTGSANFKCDNGTWVWMGGTCDGKVVNTAIASGTRTECSSSDPVRSKWIGWYLNDFKRCAGVDGLDWWVTQYNNNNGCLASNNYDGYGTKDACWRWHFQEGGRASYEEAQSTGHISFVHESIFCGPNAAYPWANVAASGTQCKYKP